MKNLKVYKISNLLVFFNSVQMFKIKVPIFTKKYGS